MFVDKELTFSDSQADVRNTGTYASTNDIDLGKGGDAERQLYIVSQVDTGFVSGTPGGTLTINLITSDDAAFGTSTTLLTTGALGVASLAAGAEPIKTRLPRGLKRYLRVNYVVATQNLTVGLISTFLTPSIDTNKIV